MTAREVIQRAYWDWLNEGCDIECYGRLVELVDNYLRDAGLLNEWRDDMDELPIDKDRQVIVCLEEPDKTMGGPIGVGRVNPNTQRVGFVNGRFHFDLPRVVAWMYAPLPPGGGDG